MHLLTSPTQGLCSNPRHQPKGHDVPLGWCACRSSSPVLGGVLMASFCLFFQLFWSVKPRATYHGNSRCLIVDCDDYSFALLVNEGSFKNPRHPATATIGRITTSFKWQLSPAPSNLCLDSKALMEVKHKPSH